MLGCVEIVLFHEQIFIYKEVDEIQKLKLKNSAYIKNYVYAVKSSGSNTTIRNFPFS